jgi:hypothetical protein
MTDKPLTLEEIDALERHLLKRINYEFPDNPDETIDAKTLLKYVVAARAWVDHCDPPQHCPDCGRTLVPISIRSEGDLPGLLVTGETPGHVGASQAPSLPNIGDAQEREEDVTDGQFLYQPPIGAPGAVPWDPDAPLPKSEGEWIELMNARDNLHLACLAYEKEIAKLVEEVGRLTQQRTAIETTAEARERDNSTLRAEVERLTRERDDNVYRAEIATLRKEVELKEMFRQAHAGIVEENEELRAESAHLWGRLENEQAEGLALRAENERLKAQIHVQDKDAAEEGAYLRGEIEKLKAACDGHLQNAANIRGNLSAENEMLREALARIMEQPNKASCIAVARAALQSKGE